VVDVFDEVEEQLRSDRYKTLALKSLPWLGALTAAVVIGFGGYWGYTAYQSSQADKSSEAYQAALEGFQKDGAAKGFARFETISKSGADVYRGLALMQMGGIRLDEGKTADAVVYFDESAKHLKDPVLGDVARLKSAYALMDTASYKDIEARLTPLTGEKSPYRIKAKEALAFAKLQAGDLAGAKGDFVVLSQLLEASEETRQRAQAAMEMIDSGSAKALPAVVKAAMALPPPIQLAPGQLPPGLQAAPNASAPAQ
jgi:hypothetical protein